MYKFQENKVQSINLLLSGWTIFHLDFHFYKLECSNLRTLRVPRRIKKLTFDNFQTVGEYRRRSDTFLVQFRSIEDGQRSHEATRDFLRELTGAKALVCGPGLDERNCRICIRPCRFVETRALLRNNRGTKRRRSRGKGGDGYRHRGIGDDIKEDDLWW